jgi:hypothetical protein
VPLIVQKELMRHAGIQTATNIDGKAMRDTKRQAHRKVAEIVPKCNKTGEAAGQAEPTEVWELTGAMWRSEIRATN